MKKKTKTENAKGFKILLLMGYMALGKFDSNPWKDGTVLRK